MGRSLSSSTSINLQTAKDIEIVKNHYWNWNWNKSEAISIINSTTYWYRIAWDSHYSNWNWNWNWNASHFNNIWNMTLNCDNEQNWQPMNCQWQMSNCHGSIFMEYAKHCFNSALIREKAESKEREKGRASGHIREKWKFLHITKIGMWNIRGVEGLSVTHAAIHHARMPARWQLNWATKGRKKRRNREMRRRRKEIAQNGKGKGKGQELKTCDKKAQNQRPKLKL